MNPHTETIAIAAAPERVLDLVADLERLPLWAIGFAKDVRLEGGRWLVRTAGGEELGIRVEVDRERGTVDYFMSPAPGVELPARTRVLPCGDGAAYVFTLFQPPGMPDEAFRAQREELARELTVLRARVESSCPL